MLGSKESRAELYGWDTLKKHPSRLVISEGEFDRLVLEGYGIASVTSTAGTGTFREWADALSTIEKIYLCFGPG